jgi:ribosome-associated translation inhibitor RaiA
MARSDRSAGAKKTRQRRERREPFAAGIPKGQKTAIGRSTTRETPLQVRVRGVELDDTMRDYMRARVGFKLGKFALHLTRVTVRLENVAGPKGAPAYACKIKVLLPNASDVVVAATDVTARAAFDLAVDATERSVRRTLGRGRAVRARS